jgi:opacity protein-like surface antigen
MALTGRNKLNYDEANGDKYEIQKSTSIFNGGFGVFFDATYAEIGLGFDFAKSSPNTKTTINGQAETGNTNTDPMYKISYFSFSLLGKYPFALGSKVKLSPMVGFDWNIATSVTMQSNNGNEKVKRSDFLDDYKNMYDAFVINVGVGADFALSQKLYLRASLMYGFKPKNKYEKDQIEADKATHPGAESKPGLTGGPTIKVGVGYKF